MTATYVASDWVGPVTADQQVFGEALINKVNASQMRSRMAAATSSLRSTLAAVMRALKLDVAGGFLVDKARWVFRWLASGMLRLRPVGWKAPVALLATSSGFRGMAMDVVATVVTWVKKPFSWLGKLLRYVPFIGKPVVNTVERGYKWVEDRVVNAAIDVDNWLTDREDSLLFGAVRAASFGMIVARLIIVLLPPQYRVWARVLVVLATLATMVNTQEARDAYQKIANDKTVVVVKKDVSEAGEKIKQTVRTTAADVTDRVADRVMDGPATTERARWTTSGQVLVKATGTIVDVVVDTDHWGQQRVMWDGQYFDWDDDLGAVDTDPISRIAKVVVDTTHKIDDEGNISPLEEKAEPKVDVDAAKAASTTVTAVLPDTEPVNREQRRAPAPKPPVTAKEVLTKAVNSNRKARR